MNPVKDILWIMFISAPSVILSGYAVYKLREILFINYGIAINDSAYWPVLFFTMWAVLWLSSKRILKKVFSREPEKENKWDQK